MGHLLDDLDAIGPPTAEGRAEARALHEALGARLPDRTLAARARLAQWLARHGT